MSKKGDRTAYEKSLVFRFRQWMSGEKDPFIGNVEMKPQPMPENPEKKFEPIDPEAIRTSRWDIFENKTLRKANKAYIAMSIVVCLALVVLFAYTVSFMPPVGCYENPVNNETAARYVEKGLEETGSENSVTGMILTYRAFDTFGETTVLFIATCCVMILLTAEEKKHREEENVGNILSDLDTEPDPDTILKTIAKPVIPLLFLFGIYVILNGHSSPGGGFAGGAIMGAGMILHATSYGFHETAKWFNDRVYAVIRVAALLLYGIVETYYFYTGANGLPTIVSLGTIQEIADICVGIVVACTMYAFFALFRKGGLS